MKLLILLVVFFLSFLNAKSHLRKAKAKTAWPYYYYYSWPRYYYHPYTYYYTPATVVRSESSPDVSK